MDFDDSCNKEPLVCFVRKVLGGIFRISNATLRKARGIFTLSVQIGIL